MTGRRYAGRYRARVGAAVLAALAVAAGAFEAAGQSPGETNTLTDVPGLKVGHETRTGDGYRTGTTVILTKEGATAAYDTRGGGPGTRETDALAPGGLVTEANAVVLSGGSAYGLDTATGVMRWLEERGHGFPVGEGVVPIVPAAILFDLGRGGDFSARPDADFGYRAAEAATDAPVEMGRVGAGTGASNALGSASTVLPNGHTVGAIVGLNPGGSPVNPETCLPYGHFLELDDEFDLSQPALGDCPASGKEPADASSAYEDPFNTTIALVATDAPLDQTEAERMAQVANTGLARAIRPVHNLGDGDTVFGLATTEPTSGELSTAELQAIYDAAADTLGRAVVHALLRDGDYCQNHPGVCGSVGNPP